jgi:hypothetical protein
MINKISAVLTIVLSLGSASVASAATSHQRHHGYAPRGQLMLLENVPAKAAAADMKAAVNFQNNWNISY